MTPSTSVLLLRAVCDFSQLPSLWAQLEEQITYPAEDWRILLSHQRLREAPLKCDILLLPSVEQTPDGGEYDNEFEMHDYEEWAHLSVDHGLIVYPGQILLPCGNDNLLSQEESTSGANKYLLSLSDCSLLLSGSVSLTLSTTDVQEHEQVVWSKHVRGGQGTDLSHITRSLTLDSPLDDHNIQSLRLERSNTALLRASKQNHSRGVSAEEFGQTMANQSRATRNSPSQSIQNDCPQYNQELSTSMACPSFFPCPLNFGSSHQQEQLLEERLREELQSIQFVTNLMVMLPSLALIAVGVWVFSERQPSLVASIARFLDCAVAKAKKSCQVSGIFPNQPASSVSTPPTRSTTTAEPVTKRDEGKENKSKADVEVDVKADVKAAVVSPVFEDEAETSTMVGSSPPESNDHTSTKVSKVADEPLQISDTLLSPCSRLKMEWERKQRGKKQPKESTSHTVAHPKSKATPISPDSISPPKLKRSSRGMVNLHLAAETENKIMQQHLRPRPVLQFGDSVDDASSLGHDGQRPRGVKSTNTFVDDYW